MKKLLRGLALAIGAAGLAAAGAHAQDTELVAYWAFDDSDDDSVAVDEIDGIVAANDGGAVYVTDADRGSVLDFDGTGSLYVADAGFMNGAGTNNQFSLVFWQKSAATPPSSSFWLNSNDAVREAQAHVPWSDDQIYFDTGGCCDPGTQRINFTPEVNFLDGKWHHFAFIKNEDDKQIFVDGVLAFDGVNTNPVSEDMLDLFIGGADGGNVIAARMDEFAIFTTALAPGQVEALADGATPQELVDDSDTDNDGMPDGWEKRNGLDPDVNDADGDLDGDGVTNLNEYENCTDPQKDDTDGDGVKDGAETNTGIFVDATNTGTDPRKTDSDSDKLSDGVETGTGTFVSADNTGTDPNKKDTDGDKFKDGVEVKVGTDPTKADSFPESLWEVVTVEGLDPISNVETAEEWLADDTLDRTEGAHLALNYEGTGCAGDYPDPVPFDHMEEAGEDLDLFVVQGTTTIFIAEGGVYTFGFGSDDGGYIDVGGRRVALFNANRGRDVTLGQITLIPGYYDVAALMWENGGGSCFDVFWAKGAFDAFDVGAFELLTPTSLAPEDSDGDGMDDNVEIAFFGDLSKAADGDEDSDTLSNLAETTRGTSPVSDDTDGDTLKDNVETGTGSWAMSAGGTGTWVGAENMGEWVSAEDRGTNPNSIDTDGDELSDHVETRTGTLIDAGDTGTDPHLEDTDGGGLMDGIEITLGKDPHDPADDSADLLAAWNFDDSEDDTEAVDLVSGIVAVNNGAEYVEDPERGSVMDFSGLGPLLVEDASFLNIASAADQVTFLFWQLNDDTPTSSTFWAISPSSNNGERGAQAHVPWSNNQIYFDTAGCCAAPTQRGNFTPDVDFLDDEWRHYAFVKDGEDKRVYIDGELAYETVNTDPLPDDFTELWIGSAGGGGNIVAAKVDDFGIYATALSEDQINDVKDNGFGGGSGPLFQILEVKRVSATNAEVTWQSKAGRSYSVDYSPDFVDWIEGADGIAADGDTTTFEDDSLTAATVIRYYRVREE